MTVANIYVRSTDGNNADSGATWALAKATVAGALAIATSGDTIYVSQVHAETQASAMTWTVNSGIANPIKIICANDGAEPPTTVATTGTVSTTGTFGMVLCTGTGGVYIYGLTFNCGSGAGRGDCEIGQPTGSGILDVTWDTCNFILVNTNAASGIYPASYSVSSGSRCTWINCNVKFAAVGQNVRTNNAFRWTGGGVTAGSSQPTIFMSSSQTTTPSVGGIVLLEGLDLSALSASVDLVFGPIYNMQQFIFRNCKLPASWSGNLCNTVGGVSVANRVELHNCSSNTANYKRWTDTLMGSIRDETTVVRTNGASDGTTPISWKMAASANVGFLGSTLRSPEIALWNTSTGSSKTLTVEILRDSVTNLKDNEVWLEVTYLGSASTPQSTLITDRCATPITTAADQTTSTAAWTTTGITNPNKQNLSVTFTPQMVGFYLCTVVIAKLSTTVYVDPLVTVT